MKTPNYLSVKWALHSLVRLIAIGFFVFPFTAKSQCDSIYAISCETAPVVLLENFCGRTTYAPAFCCTGFCGANTAIHNPTYLKFLALDTTVRIDIEVLPCFSGLALQAAIIPACPWDNNQIMDCDPGTPPGATMELEANDIIPGEYYWLLIDGSSGSVCSYLISHVQGAFAPYNHDVFLQQVGDTIFAVHNDTYKYVWFGCEDNLVIDTLPYLVAPASGCYCVEVYDSLYSSVFCTEVLTTSSNTLDDKAKITFYPNPSTDLVDIQLGESQTGPVTLKIFDSQGRNVDRVTIDGSQHRYTWKSDQAPGIYLFMITEGKKMLASQKVIYSHK